MILEFVVEVKQRGENVGKDIQRRDDLKANACSRKSPIRRECEKVEARISGPDQVIHRPGRALPETTSSRPAPVLEQKLSAAMGDLQPR